MEDDLVDVVAEDCDAALAAAVERLRAPIEACYPGAHFELIVSPFPGAELRIRPEEDELARG